MILNEKKKKTVTSCFSAFFNVFFNVFVLRVLYTILKGVHKHKTYPLFFISYSLCKGFPLSCCSLLESESTLMNKVKGY